MSKVDRYRRKFENRFFNGKSTCIVYLDQAVVWEGNCYVQRRRQPSNPKVEPQSRQVSLIVQVKLPLDAPLITRKHRIRITKCDIPELLELALEVKDTGFSSENQFSKNIYCEA